MRVDLGSLDIRVAEQFLEHADVHPVLQHMGRETVAQGMAADLFVKPCLLYGSLHRLLQTGFEHVVAHFPARARVRGAFTGGKDPLPTGRPARLGVFSGQRFGDVHVPEALFKVPVMKSFHRRDMRLQGALQVPGQDGSPILPALAAPDKDEVLTEVHVLDAQADTLQ